jgi:hypothetical protein
MPHREDGSPPLDLSLLELVERLSRFNKAPLEAKLSVRRYKPARSKGCKSLTTKT